MSLEFDHFIGLNTIPQGALFLPDGQKYIFSSGANVVIGDLLDPHSQEFLRGHDDIVTCIAVSSQGRFIASGQRGENADIVVWDCQTMQEVYRFEEHDHMIQSLAFSHDEKMLASIGSTEDGNLILWDMSNGCIISSSHKLPADTVYVGFAGFIKDIKRRDTNHYQLCTAGKDGVLIWDIDPYQGDILSFKLQGDARGTISRVITSLAYSPDYEYLYGATTSGDFIIGQFKTQRILRSIQATRMALHAILVQNNTIVIGCGDKTIKLYNLNGDFLTQVELDGGVIGLSLSPDQLEALATTAFGSIARVNLSSLEYILISESHTNSILKVVFDEGKNERFATIAQDGTIKVWDLAEYTVISTSYARKEQEAKSTPLCLAFANILFSGWSDGRVLAHSAESGENLWILDNVHAQGVTALVLSHNRRFILTGGPQGEVRLWELRTRELISHLKEHKQKITSMKLFQDDTFAVSGSRDRCILRWDLRTEKRSFCHMQRMGGINDFVLTHDDQFIISVGQDHKIVIWDNRMEQPIFQQFLQEENDEGFAIAMSHDGQYVVTGGTAGILRIWQSHLPSPHLSYINQYVAHSKAITSIAFSLNDKQLVSVGEDGGIMIWWFLPQ